MAIVNQNSGIAARNGTTTHTINFGFTSTSSNVLVFIVFGPVTHSATGWTERLQPVSSGELSVFTKTSTGDSSITITHNGSNYRVLWAVYELSAGSSWITGTSNTPTADTFPTLSGLPGTEVMVWAARGTTVTRTDSTNASSVWPSPWIEDSDRFIVNDGINEGSYLTVARREAFTGTSITPTATTTYSGTWSLADREHVVFAMAVPSGEGGVPVVEANETDEALPIIRSFPGILNRTVGIGGRNGTDTHTITFPNAQAGSLLVAIVGGPITDAWPAEWTEQLQPISQTELSVATKIATAGENSVTITHNVANKPIVYEVFEFAAGSTWVAGTSSADTSTWPTLTGLPGTRVRAYAAFSHTLTETVPSITAQWNSPWRSDTTESIEHAENEGVILSVGYLDTTATSTTPSATFSNGTASERVVFAVTVADVDLAENPVVTAGISRPVVNSGTVGLDVTATAPDGETISSHAWEIISGGGSLTNANTATPTYTAPSSGLGTAIIRDTVTASGGGSASAEITVAYGPNIVAAENLLPGTPRATWDLAAPDWAGISTLQGFCDGFTANKDETVNFKIAQSDSAGWSAQIYRLGYYGGDGARFYGTLTPNGTQLANSQSQPAPNDIDPNTTKISADCSNWSITLTWTPPAWVPSGFYILRLNRTGGGASHVMFILRDDSREAELMMMPADSTWTAYNAFGGMGANLLTGNSLYFGTSVDQYNNDSARFVSYNRPIVNRAAVSGGYGAVQWSTFFTGEYPMLRFIERNGIDVKYYGCIDASGDPTGAKLNVNAAMFVGHNEYWSDNMRAGWEAAKANGVSIFSCSGNEVFWRTIGHDDDASGRPRTIECYKSTIASRGSVANLEWTGTWRDPDGAGKGGDNPENLFTGTIFVVNGPDLRALTVPFNGGYSAKPLWRHTTVAALTSGQSWTSPSQILGFEWDTYGPEGVNTTGAAFLADPPPQSQYCSNVTYSITGGNVLTDAGDQYGNGTVTHRLVVHPGGNNAIVFGTGTVNWALGVDNANTYQVGNDNTTDVIQQATINMLVDMGVTPTTLMFGLTQPTPQTWFGATEVGVNQAIETDVAQPIARRKVKTIGQVIETDTVTTVRRVKRKLVVSTVEVETALNVVVVQEGLPTIVAVGQVTESDSVFAIIRAKRKAIATVLESDTAGSIAKPGNVLVSFASETDLAQPVRVIRVRTIGQATTTEATFVVTARHARSFTVGQAIEIDSVVGAVRRTKIKHVNQSIQTDVARPISNLSILPPPPDGPVATVIVAPYEANVDVSGYTITVTL